MKKVHFEVLECEEQITNETIEERCQINEFLCEEEQEENIEVDFGASNVDEQIKEMQSELRTFTFESTQNTNSNQYTNSSLAYNFIHDQNIEDIYDISSPEDDQQGYRVVTILKDLNIKIGN